MQSPLCKGVDLKAGLLSPSLSNTAMIQVMSALDVVVDNQMELQTFLSSNDILKALKNRGLVLRRINLIHTKVYMLFAIPDASPISLTAGRHPFISAESQGPETHSRRVL
jgi:hypothetical protein